MNKIGMNFGNKFAAAHMLPSPFSGRIWNSRCPGRTQSSAIKASAAGAPMVSSAGRECGHGQGKHICPGSMAPEPPRGLAKKNLLEFTIHFTSANSNLVRNNWNFPISMRCSTTFWIWTSICREMMPCLRGCSFWRWVWKMHPHAIGNNVNTLPTGLGIQDRQCLREVVGNKGLEPTGPKLTKANLLLLLLQESGAHEVHDVRLMQTPTKRTLSQWNLGFGRQKPPPQANNKTQNKQDEVKEHHTAQATPAGMNGV